jgi:hypothetical protein
MRLDKVSVTRNGGDGGKQRRQGAGIAEVTGDQIEHGMLVKSRN